MIEDFVQTISSQDMIPPEYASRLASVSQAHASLTEKVTAQTENYEQKLAHQRRLYHRYANICRLRLDRSIVEYVDGKRAAAEEDAERIRREADIAAVSLYEATRASAFREVEDSLIEIIDKAFHKMIDHTPPRELVVGAIRAAIEETRLREPATMRVSPNDKDKAREGLEEVLGDTWEEVVKLTVDPAISAGSLEMTTEGGTRLLGAEDQFIELKNMLLAGIELAEQQDHEAGERP